MTREISVKPKILLYAHEGVGMGHLSRTTKIANSLNQDFNCLVLTGLRQAAWMLDSGCDFIKLPSLDGIMKRRSEFLGTKLYFNGGEEKAKKFRKRIIDSVFEGFEPDVIITDHIPSGLNGEILDAVRNSKAKKYLVLRAVLGASHESLDHIFRNDGKDLIQNHYSRVLVAADERVSTIRDSFRYHPRILNKIRHLGYATKTYTRSEVADLRRSRGLNKQDIWIVCSAGSGRDIATMLNGFRKLTETYDTVFFDIVKGARSDDTNERNKPENDRVKETKETPILPLMHAAADIVISHGGSNSIVEAMAAKRKIIVLNKCEDPATFNEREVHAKRLSKCYELIYASNDDEMCAAIEQFLKFSRLGRSPSLELNLDGLVNLQSILFHDLNMSAKPT